jgi:DNA-binding CsgD family transcriptional regulator
MSLSDKSRAVLTLIADGYSYSQIVDGHPEISYRDIFDAAEEALEMDRSGPPYQERLSEIKRQYPNAYEKWASEEKEKLAKLASSGADIKEIAQILGRQPSAIRSQMEKQGTFSEQRNGF